MRAIFFASMGLAVAATVAIGGSASAATCTLIKTVTELEHINSSGNYCLANDIDASAIANFTPIAIFGSSFSHGSSFDGQGFTIRNLTVRSSGMRVGLFGQIGGATIQNLTLENVNIVATGANAVVGALAGAASSESVRISNVHTSGMVTCRGTSCDAGGLVGSVSSTSIYSWLQSLSSAAEVKGKRFVGGLVGFASDVTLSHTYATGRVSCSVSDCVVGGLIGRMASTVVAVSFATGPVTAAGGADGRAGGLIGLVEGTTRGRSVSASFAAGTVDGGNGAMAGGLIGQLNGSSVDQVYSVGRVGGTGPLGGLVANAAGSPPVTNAYWDVETSGRTTSAVGMGLTTSQLRSALPTGFDNSWRITEDLSYPYFRLGSLAPPLATLVQAGNVFILLPISQLDLSQYATTPAHDEADQASLATVYTMIARAVGLTEGIGRLQDVPIDRYFWDDATQRARFTGPIRSLVTLGMFTSIASGEPLDSTNVIGAMNAGKLVLLRGRFRKEDGTRGTHWVLGTLFTTDNGNPNGVVVYDPWTGRQLAIDPATKRIAHPVRTNFPLARFVVDGYQPVTIN